MRRNNRKSVVLIHWECPNLWQFAWQYFCFLWNWPANFLQISSVTQSCPTLCDPMEGSIPGFPVHHQHLELAQTHVHQVSDAIQPSHPLSSPSPPAFNFSSIRVFSNDSVLHIRWPKYWSFSFSLPMNIQDWFPLGLTGLISLQSKGLSKLFSNTTVQIHQFFCAQLSKFLRFA